MNLINKILIPVDFSDSSINAFHYAINLVKHDRTIQIILLHVIEKDDNPVEMMEAMNQFDTLKCYLPEFVDHLQIIVQHGRLIDTIAETAKSVKPKLIVMGTKGKSRSLMHSESNTSRLVKTLDQSVLVIPQTFTEFHISQMAVAIDEQIEDPSVLAVVHDLARWFGAKVHLLTIAKEKIPVESAPSDFKDTLEYYMETLDYTFHMSRDVDIVNGISSYIRENNIDVLAILPKTHAKYGTPSAGRLTRVLTLQSHIPLLIID